MSKKPIENLGFIYSQAIDYKDRKWQRQIRKKLVRRLKKNPTPKLRELRGLATFLIKQLGKQAALLQAIETQKTNLRYGRALQHMIERMQIKKLRKRPVRKTMYDKLIEEFGTTSPMSARGFILDDGECLNLGSYDDHRIINCVYADSDAAEKRYGSRYRAFRHLCEIYNMIRWTPESKTCEVFVPPTGRQISAMRELAEEGMLKQIEVWSRGKATVLEAEDADTLIAGVEAVYS